MLYTISISFMINIRRSEVYSILRAAFSFVVTVSAFIIKYIHHFGDMYLPLYICTLEMKIYLDFQTEVIF